MFRQNIWPRLFLFFVRNLPILHTRTRLQREARFQARGLLADLMTPRWTWQSRSLTNEDFRGKWSDWERFKKESKYDKATRKQKLWKQMWAPILRQTLNRIESEVPESRKWGSLGNPDIQSSSKGEEAHRKTSTAEMILEREFKEAMGISKESHPPLSFQPTVLSHFSNTTVKPVKAITPKYQFSLD